MDDVRERPPRSPCLGGRMRAEGYKFQGSGFRVNGFLAKRGFS